MKIRIHAYFHHGVFGYPQADSFAKTPAKAMETAASMPPKVLSNMGIGLKKKRAREIYMSDYKSTKRDKMRQAKESCFNCLYCKVSAKSTKNCRLCFCSKTKDRGRHKEHYWLTKKVCEKFYSMSV